MILKEFGWIGGSGIFLLEIEIIFNRSQNYRTRVRTKPNQFLEKILLNYIFQKTPFVSIRYSKYLNYPSRYQAVPNEKLGYPPGQPHLRIIYFPRLPSDVNSNLARATINLMCEERELLHTLLFATRFACKSVGGGFSGTAPARARKLMWESISSKYFFTP